MNKINLDDMSTLQFGSDFTITGMLMTNGAEDSIVIVLPEEDVNEEQIQKLMTPTGEEIQKIFDQLDTVETEVIRGNKKVILRKSQRNIDGKISWAVFRRDGFICRYCGEDEKQMTIDHIITWEAGGATHVDNLLCACKKCNKTRGNMSYEDWLETDYYKEKIKNVIPLFQKLNEELKLKLDSLPRLKVKRSR